MEVWDARKNVVVVIRVVRALSGCSGLWNTYCFGEELVVVDLYGGSVAAKETQESRGNAGWATLLWVTGARKLRPLAQRPCLLALALN